MSTKVVTGLSRLSYVYAFEPYIPEGEDEGKYQITILIPKADKVTIKKIEAAIEEAAELGKSTKWEGKRPVNLVTTFRDGDEPNEDGDIDPNEAGCMVLKAKSIKRPGVVDKDLNAILDPDELYSGCYGRVSVNIYPYIFSGKKGISAGLLNIQKLKDGERLGGGSSPEEDFADDFDIDLIDDLL